MRTKFLINLFFILFLPFNSYALTATISPPIEPAKASLPKINLNKADSKTLANSISGIGPKRAEAIVKYREEHKGFKSLEELAQVPGLGSKFIAKHQQDISSLFTLATS